MRVAFITHYESLYGANRSLLGLIDGLREYGVIPFVIGREAGAIGGALKARSVPFTVVPFEWWARSRPTGKGLQGKVRSYVAWKKQAFGRHRQNRAVLPELTRILREWDVDIVYSNSSVTPIGYMAARCVLRPHVWHLREFCDLHFGLEYDWGRRWFEYIVGRSAAVISVSRAVEDYYLKKVDTSRKHVVYNGVASRAAMAGLQAKRPVEKGNRPYSFVMIGAIQPNKGHHEALQALAELAAEGRDVRLRIVGEGDRSGLDGIIAELGLADIVECPGYVDDPFAVLLAADALLVCSRHEALGRVTAEAMAAGRPVIGYDQAGTAELVLHEQTGLLYRRGSQELAACMRRFINNPGWAAALGENGGRVAIDRFTLETYAKSVNTVLHAVIGEAGLPRCNRLQGQGAG